MVPIYSRKATVTEPFVQCTEITRKIHICLLTAEGEYVGFTKAERWIIFLYTVIINHDVSSLRPFVAQLPFIVGSITTWGNAIFIILISCFSIEAKRDIEFCHSTLNVSRIGRKVDNRIVLTGTNCLIIIFSGSLCLPY